MSDANRHALRLALDRKDAAEALGLGVDAFDRYVRPYVRCVYVGSVRRWPVSELQAWLERSASRSDATAAAAGTVAA
jgi:predicted DNA-binding transcriptional regulator AlpA